MKLATLRTLLLFVCLIAISGIGKAQINHEILDKPDTLSGVERLSLRTNMVDWTLLMPNIAVEYDLGKTTRNHWTAGLSIRGNWQTKHTFNPGLVFNVAEVRGEFRYYWRTRLVTDKVKKHEKVIIRPHKSKTVSKKSKDALDFSKEEKEDTIIRKNYLGKLFSCRRDTFWNEVLDTIDGKPLLLSEYKGKKAALANDDYYPLGLKHPNTTYYRGFYASYNKYSIKLTQTGYQGSAVNAGFVYGIVKPLYQFANGNALDLDLGISAGLCMAKYDEYELDRESNCYPLIKKNDWKIVPFPVINEARVALVYRFSKDRTHQLGYRYRWRYDVDKDYRYELDSILLQATDKAKESKRLSQSLNNLDEAFDVFFMEVYSDLKQKQQDARNELEKKRKAEAEKARQDKLKEQEARAQAKAEEQAQREAAKRAREEEKQAKKKKSSEETPAEQSPEVSEQPEEGKEAAQ